MINERDYIDSEILEIGELHAELVERHKLCEGTGMSLEEKGVSDCVCELVFKYLKELIYSNIPRGYWGISVKDFSDYFGKGNEAREFKSVQFTESISVMGFQGAGKTAFLSLLGKLAIQEGKSVFYITPENLLKIIRDEEILVERLKGSEIVLMDSVNRYNRSKWADGQVEYFLRSLNDAGKIICLTESEKGDQSEGIVSFLQSHIRNNFIISFNGKKKGLKITDYFNKELVVEAEIGFEEVLEIK